MKRKGFFTAFCSLAMVFFMGVILSGCMSLGGGVKVISTYQTQGMSIEQHARVYIDDYVQVIGVDGKMSPLKYIAQAGNVILLAPGSHTLNINTYDSYANDHPRYPGREMTITVEAGKYYRFSSTMARVGPLYDNTTFYFEDFDNPLEDAGRVPLTNETYREDLRTKIDNSLSK